MIGRSLLPSYRGKPSSHHPDPGHSTLPSSPCELCRRRYTRTSTLLVHSEKSCPATRLGINFCYSHFSFVIAARQFCAPSFHVVVKPTRELGTHTPKSCLQAVPLYQPCTTFGGIAVCHHRKSLYHILESVGLWIQRIVAGLQALAVTLPMPSNSRTSLSLHDQEGAMGMCILFPVIDFIRRQRLDFNFRICGDWRCSCLRRPHHQIHRDTQANIYFSQIDLAHLNINHINLPHPRRVVCHLPVPTNTTTPHTVA